MKFIDLTNEKFGKLTAISINKKENKKHIGIVFAIVVIHVLSTGGD